MLDIIVTRMYAYIVIFSNLAFNAFDDSEM